MTADDITRIIQLILAPVVMVTACAITLSGLHAHSQAINDRLRTMVRERLDLLREVLQPDPLRDKRLIEIDRQIPELLARHELMRQKLSIQSAVVLFVVCMLAIAAAITSGLTLIAESALGLFVVATLLLLIGVVRSAIEVTRSHDALKFEAERVRGLKPRDA